MAPSRLLHILCVPALLALVACGKGPRTVPEASTDEPSTPAPPSAPAATYKVSGTVQGFVLGSLQIKLNGAETLTLNGGATTFDFSTELSDAAAYSVAVTSQGSLPTMTCAVNRASGNVASANVTDVEIRCPVLQSVSVSSSSTQLYPATSFTLKAVGLYNDGLVRDLSSLGTWSSDDAAIVSLNGKSGTTVGAGSTVARFAFGTTNGSVNLTVKSGTLSSLSISPGNLSLPVGVVKKFSVSGIYSDGSVQDLTSTATWSSGTPAAATVDNSSAKGQVTAVAAGTTVLTAQVGAISATRTITVNAATIVDLDVSPGFVNDGISAERQLKVTATDSDGATWDVSSSVSWSSSAPEKASVSSSGLLSLNAVGSATITATLGALSETLPVQILSKTLSSLAIENAGTILPTSAQRRLKATATYSDLSTDDVTEQVAWISASPEIASTIDVAGDRGLVIAGSAGTSRITVSMNGITGSADLTVTNAAPVSLKMNPGETLLPKAINMNFRLYGVYADASEHELTRSATWSSSNSSYAEISNSAPLQGALTNKYTGSSYANVTATAAFNALWVSASVILTPSTLSSIALTPASVSLAPFKTVKLRAFGQFSDGGSVDMSELVSWSSNAKAIASVTNADGQKGFVSTLSEGSATVSAKLSSITGTRSLTVSSTDPESVVEEGMGLKGSYYGSKDLTVYKGSRIDGTVNFNWASGLAPLGVGDNFSVRWTGFVKTTVAGSYQFCTISDDGVRVTVNGTSVINNWTDHSATENCGGITLAAGAKVPIVVDFYENGGDAVMRLFWTPPSGTKVTIPRSALFDQ